MKRKQDALEHEQRRQVFEEARERRSARAGGAGTAVQRALGRGHQQRVQRGHRQDAVGERSDQQVRQEQRARGLRAQIEARKQQRQRHRQRRYRQHDAAQRLDPHRQAFDPHHHDADPQRGREDRRESEVPAALAVDRRVQRSGVQRKPDQHQRTREPDRRPPGDEVGERGEQVNDNQ